MSDLEKQEHFMKCLTFLFDHVKVCRAEGVRIFCKEKQFNNNKNDFTLQASYRVLK